jgi:alkylation response protein AidB-like acyl-CoA dehydrogenase
MARLQEFRGIEGTDFFEQDRGFQLLLGQLLGEYARAAVFSSLHQCARLVAGPWNDLACEASRAENLPRIVKYDRVGNRQERVDFGPLTRQLRREVAEFGVLTRADSELHRFAMIYFLGHNGEASLTCGTSCTDGLIRSIEAKGDQFLRETYLPRLKSADTPLAGAQFVTERSGGSDVGAIETEARLNEDGTWSLTGEKWFCSNPDEFYLVAARPAGAAAATRGLAIFLVPRVLESGRLNSLSFRRLKDKLGTRSLPTAEIDFESATAYAIGDPSEGFKTLMNYVINTSRIHNAVNSCGFLHRAFLEARNYARQRRAFGHALVEYPLIQETLVGLLETLWRNRLVTFRLVALLDEHGLVASDAGQAMWQRFLINLAKYRTAFKLTDWMREAILIFGANGVVEDFTVLPRLLRDSLVIETWEGPHNTLCLQIVRDAARSHLLERWHNEVSAAFDGWPKDFLSLTRNRFEHVFKQVTATLSKEKIGDERWAERNARRFVDRLGELLEVVWMAELALRDSGRDSTAGLLTALAAHQLWPGDDLFESPTQSVLALHAPALIEEEIIQADLCQQ